MLRMNSYRRQITGIIGNLLEHYDTALFGLLAPFIAPLFFYNMDPILALIFTYGILPLGLLTRPLGSLFFGWLGDSVSSKTALCLSLLGTSIITVGMGCLPTGESIGPWSPILLAVARMLQSFFSAGESTGGALLILEGRGESKKNGFLSSIYDASTLAGILIASGIIFFMSSQQCVEECWRIPFWAGGGTALIGLFMRSTIKEAPRFVPVMQKKIGAILKEHKGLILTIALVSGFSHTTYHFAFTFLNGYIPLITNISHTQAIEINTFFLVLDMLLLPCFGYLSLRFGKEKMMLIGAVGSAFLVLPLFILLSSASFFEVLAIRFLLVVFGICFAAPYHAWALEKVPSGHRYIILAFGFALGSQLIGAPTSVICLGLYKATGWHLAPGLYLMCIGLGASAVIYHHMKQEKEVISSLNVP